MKKFLLLLCLVIGCNPQPPTTKIAISKIVREKYILSGGGYPYLIIAEDNSVIRTEDSGKFARAKLGEDFYDYWNESYVNSTQKTKVEKE